MPCQLGGQYILLREGKLERKGLMFCKVQHVPDFSAVRRQTSWTCAEKSSQDFQVSFKWFCEVPHGVAVSGCHRWVWLAQPDQSLHAWERGAQEVHNYTENVRFNLKLQHV